jgi:hypothetical protein
MNSKQAKRIKKEIYGEFSPKLRKYKINRETRQIWADDRRRKYQQAKKDYKNGRI